MKKTKQNKVQKQRIIISITSVLTTKLIQELVTLMHVQTWKQTNLQVLNNTKIFNEISDMLTGIGCPKSTFSFKAKDAKPYQAPSGCEAYALH